LGNLPLIHLESEELELDRRELDKQEVEQPEVDRFDLAEPGVATSEEIPGVEVLALTLATTGLLRELRTLDLLSMILKQSRVISFRRFVVLEGTGKNLLRNLETRIIHFALISGEYNSILRNHFGGCFRAIEPWYVDHPLEVEEEVDDFQEDLQD
ncbi:hypothetical protein Tco_0901718, partial [Tanacetum coccineum]